MYVEAYEMSSKRSIFFSNNAFARNVHHRSLRVIFSKTNKVVNRLMGGV